MVEARLHLQDEFRQGTEILVNVARIVWREPYAKRGEPAGVEHTRLHLTSNQVLTVVENMDEVGRRIDGAIRQATNTEAAAKVEMRRRVLGNGFR